jgi:hypothetical protein
MKKYYLLFSLSLLAILVLTPSCVGTSEVVARGQNQFPQVGGMNLHGDEKQFPECLTADKTFIVVAFQRWQQTWVDEWYKEIGPAVDGNTTLAYYEVPTISKLSGPIRWWIYKGMQGGIEDEKMRSSVITLHIDKEPFTKELNINDEEIVYTFILDKEGNILSRQDGRFTQEKWQALIKGTIP